MFSESSASVNQVAGVPVMASNQIGSAVRTKIVATLGPASESEEMIRELLLAGVDVFRLNMAHGELPQHESLLYKVRRTSDQLERPVAVLVDLAGPKIRLGELPGDAIECRLGDEFRFVRGTATSNPRELVTSYAPLIDELSPGDRVMLADGTVGLKVVSRDEAGALARVTKAGTIRSRQGVNLPGIKLRTAALTPADRQHAAWAARVEADFVGLSFVRSPDDVQQLKSLLAARGSSARVVAKIEKPEALQRLDEIIGAADCIMIARGDLGVEIDVAEVPLVQKRIISRCRLHQKPVITATQMLESMQVSSRPTRAEASDVANAIIDGSDACMLSGETAIGKFPKEAVEMMNRIAEVTEEQLRDFASPFVPVERVAGLHPVTEAVVSGASAMARQLAARLIVVSSHSGATALALSKQRNFVPTLGVSDSQTTLRQMCLYWGVTPRLGFTGQTPAQLIAQIESWGLTRGVLAADDRLVLVTGTGAPAAGHNLVMVHQVGSSVLAANRPQGDLLPGQRS
jgi:pyruvate kinase